MENNTQDIKAIAFIICLKRFKRNSVVLKKSANYKLAKKLNIHPTTFKKYLRKAIDDGSIKTFNNHYKISKFPSIISEKYENTDLYFGKHDVLSSNKLNFKEVLTQIEQNILIDNIIKPQEREISRKKKYNRINNILNSNQRERTEKKYLSRVDKKFYMKERKKKKCVLLPDNDFNVTDAVVTSCRHTAQSLGISRNKANKLLSSLKGYKRVIVVKWLHGVSYLSIKKAQMTYPKASVIPLPHYNKIKVCFGSELSQESKKKVLV